MAISKNVTKQTLTLNADNGLDALGKTKIKAYNFSGIRPEADADALLQTANAIGELMNSEVVSVVVTEKAEIIKE